MSAAFIIGVDLASGTDLQTDTLCRVMPDGRCEIVAIHSYRRTIDLAPVEYRDERPAALASEGSTE